LAAFATKTGFVMGLPFHAESAVAYCRRIGLTDLALRAYWQSAVAPLEFHFDPAVPEPLVTAITAVLLDVYGQAALRLQVQLAGTDRVVVATTPKALRALISDHVDYEIFALSEGLEEECSSERNIDGATSPGLLRICVNPLEELGVGIEHGWFRFFLAHESTHLIQFQVNGVLPPGASTSEMLKSEGAIWLQEGLAQVFANVVTTGETEAYYRSVMLSRFLGEEWPDLAELAERPTKDRSVPGVYYRAGAIAAADLIEAHGYPAFGQLFKALGEGVEWEAAFEKSFGQSLDDFYAAFAARPRE
jgi:hypothetical protein